MQIILSGRLDASKALSRGDCNPVFLGSRSPQKENVLVSRAADAAGSKLGVKILPPALGPPAGGTLGNRKLRNKNLKRLVGASLRTSRAP